MIKIIISQKNDNILGYEVSGHSGYSEIGSDIVCSAVSSITLMTYMGISKILKINVNLVRKDKEGYFKLTLPKNILSSDNEKCQILLKTMVLSLKELLSDYKQYIKLEVQDEFI